MEICTKITEDVERRHQRAGLPVGKLLQVYGIRKSAYYGRRGRLWCQLSKASVFPDFDGFFGAKGVSSGDEGIYFFSALVVPSKKRVL